MRLGHTLDFSPQEAEVPDTTRGRSMARCTSGMNINAAEYEAASDDILNTMSVSELRRHSAQCHDNPPLSGKRHPTQMNRKEGNTMDNSIEIRRFLKASRIETLTWKGGWRDQIVNK